MGRKSGCADFHELILEMNAQGYERWEIAAKIGTTKAALQAYLQRRKITPAWGGAISLLRHEDVIRQCVEHDRMTQAEVAAKFGVDTSTIERFCARMKLNTARTGPRGAERQKQWWHGGRHLEKHWYVSVFAPMHPHAKQNGYVGEHRLVLEVALGRYLLPTGVVDHIDCHTQHNWPSNLRPFDENAEHLRVTLKGKYGESQIRAIFGPWSRDSLNGPVPTADETLLQCTDAERKAIERHVAIHRPTEAHAHLPRRHLWRKGAWEPVFTEHAIPEG